MNKVIPKLMRNFLNREKRIGENNMGHFYIQQCLTEGIKCIRDKKLKESMRCIKSALPATMAAQITYIKHWGKVIHWNKPKSLDERLLVLHCKEYRKNAMITMCSDKYRVRTYIEKCGYKHLLTKLYGVYDNVSQIDFDILPDSFVIKCNHGCGYNIIVRDKEQINWMAEKDKLDKWMSINYGIRHDERVYSEIQPKIIIESLIETEDGCLPTDYKFISSYGRVICCLLVIDRGYNSKLLLIDRNFHRLKYINETDSFKEYLEDDYVKYRPKTYDEMWNIACNLSKDFPFVRVDLYDSNGEIFFGELTFSPHGCIHDYFTRQGNYWIGNKMLYP